MSGRNKKLSININSEITPT